MENSSLTLGKEKLVFSILILNHETYSRINWSA